MESELELVSTHLCCLLFLLLIISISPGYLEASSSSSSSPKLLFVFGDSYADTGNLRKSLGNSWKDPYGTTFPGKPAGRFSDGRVLSDYLAKFLGLSSPFPYTWMKLAGDGKKLRAGMNFAYGGSGVFDTYAKLPNMTTQIDFFDNLIATSFYTKHDVYSSLVLVCLSGNDYGAFIAKGGAVEDIEKFIPLVIDQLVANLKRISRLGASKVVVTTLQPMGCLPRTTRRSSYQKCNTTENMATSYHNLLLQQAVAGLNNISKSPSFFVMDLYRSFTAVLDPNQDSPGDSKFQSLLKPCCIGVNDEHSCGSVDDNGKKLYTVCSDPRSAFFWDEVHPTEAGWRAVYTMLRSSLGEFVKSS
ncbi:GDSL esterase/lipase At5g03610-like [Andrographis paniculata]|uniref:GDSL esterase/lipase At5g03610-like n=1 Tax=Andrographis paniculata TaxID=175694 RepID=UPI0021E77C5C|nr:GDSL esterase/lipase At5g03610-like [Andrographis paniculata]